jgi:alpha-amylase/alpha-mannosidase (GH57 family)
MKGATCVMPEPKVRKYVCLHGHFYQPPRENPWLEALEREESAQPYHDWNKRISDECYRANAASRLVDDENHIVTLCNNYQSLSFNFGPTLLRWLEQHEPWVYDRVREADRESCHRLQGHGNAIAQVYNHVIMPLATRRDKLTQVRWGIRDFQHRFGRCPEGMWLAETAVDDETLGILAEEGIQYTILSPFQAARWRFLNMKEESPWQNAQNGDIPPGRAYRYHCGNQRTIYLFFYDSNLSHGIAFGHLLENSTKLLRQMDASFQFGDLIDSEPWLVHAATDGETFGHHFQFGDMAIAATFNEIQETSDVEIINYGAFLASFPVRAQVEIRENTAWSCAHGLGRWQEDCGCHVGGQPHWNQKWRAPLRGALNHLQDALSSHYEREMGQLSQDPWDTRDHYIDVLLDPDHHRAEFLDRYSRRSLNADEKCRFFQLLEMERCALFMFTSCGWFFDDIGGLETILILRYAARAIQLAEQTGAPPLEPSFFKILEKAPSNVPEYENGGDVYLRKVKPFVITPRHVAANHAIQTFVDPLQSRNGLYCYHITPRHQEHLGSSPIPCQYGHITVRDDRTSEEKDYFYTVLHFGGLDFRCSVKLFKDSKEYGDILTTLRQAVEKQNTVGIVRILDDAFGTAFFTLHDVFQDMRRAIALEIGQGQLRLYRDFQRYLYQTHSPLIKSLEQWGVEFPEDLRTAVEHVLNDELHQLVQEILEHESGQEPSFSEGFWEETDFFYRSHMGRLRSILGNAQSWGIALQPERTAVMLGEAMVSTMNVLLVSYGVQNAGKMLRLLEICLLLDVMPEIWLLQTLYYELVRKVTQKPEVAGEMKGCEGFFLQMDTFLGCRFAHFLDQRPTSL